jgi:pilus assembly protein CpaB
MRWAIVGLIVLGTLAAACAALLVATFASGPKMGQQYQTDIVVAARAMPEGTKLTVDCLRLDTINKREVPPNCFGKSFDVIGSVLAQKVEEGQKITRECLASTGPIPVAADKRLYTFAPLDASILDVLTPGCKVDVIFTRTKESELPVPHTILNGITVKAVDSASAGSTKREDAIDSTRRAGGRTVTLELTPRECEAVNMAKTMGSLTLIMCSPDTPRSKTSESTSLETLLGLASKPAPAPPPPPTTTAPEKWINTVITHDEHGNPVTKDHLLEMPKPNSDPVPNP